MVGMWELFAFRPTSLVGSGHDAGLSPGSAGDCHVLPITCRCADKLVATLSDEAIDELLRETAVQERALILGGLPPDQAREIAPSRRRVCYTFGNRRPVPAIRFAEAPVFGRGHVARFRTRDKPRPSLMAVGHAGDVGDKPRVEAAAARSSWRRADGRPLSCLVDR